MRALKADRGLRGPSDVALGLHFGAASSNGDDGDASLGCRGFAGRRFSVSAKKMREKQGGLIERNNSLASVKPNGRVNGCLEINRFEGNRRRLEGNRRLEEN